MAAKTMLALTSDTLGAPNTYALKCVPIPVPGADEILLQIEATALGYVDSLIAAGGYQNRPPAPYVPGAEIVGRIVQCGSAVADRTVGDRVASWQLLAGGGLAEFAVARATSLITLPDDIGPAAAATLLLDYLTASYALFDRGQCQTGETVLVLGASGGVGCAAVRLAADAGARVIAAASTAEKRNYARHAGAWATVDYTLSTWRDRLRQLAPGGVDIIVDPIGGDTFEPAFRSLAKRGRHLVLGFVGGAVPALPINLPLLKNGALVGVDARHLFESDLPRAREIWADVFALAVAGRIQPPAIQSFRLSHARNALQATLNRGKLGKIVVQPDGAA